MRRRTALIAAAVTVGGMAVPILAAATAGATTSPWPSGTVFVASTGAHLGGDGALTAITPSNARTTLDTGSVQDVAADVSGTLYYVKCSGGLFSYSPTGGAAELTSAVGSCPTAVAIRPDGHLLVSSFSGLYDVTPDGATVTAVPNAYGYDFQYNSLAVDPEGDVYGANGSNQLVVAPQGGAAVAISGLFGGVGIDGLRLDGSGNMLASSPSGNAYLQSPSATTPTAVYSVGRWLNGVAVDGSQNVYVSDFLRSQSTNDQVDVFSGGNSPATVLATNFDTPAGLAAYPPLGTSRTASTVALSTDATSTTTSSDQVTLTATVDGGRTGLTGLVQFADDGRPFGDVVPMTDGVATTTTTLSSGTNHVTATYLGSSAEDPSQDGQTLQIADAAQVATTTTLTAPATAPQAAPVQVSATVTGADGGHPAGGTVDFHVVAADGTTADDQETTDAGGTATASLTLAPGRSTITATFQSDGPYAGSQGTASVRTTAPYRPTISGTVHYGKPSRTGRTSVWITVTVSGVARRYTGGVLRSPTGTLSADNGFRCSTLTRSTRTPTATATCRGVYQAGTSADVTVSYSGNHWYARAQQPFTLGFGG